ncbi:hypothetical protein Dimus_011740 [Dionaea muscipula]
MATVVRRPKWTAPPPPRILHLPRRTRRKQPMKDAAGKSKFGSDPIHGRSSMSGKLETLFDQERSFSYWVPPIVVLDSAEGGSREKVVVENDQEARVDGCGGGGGGEALEEKWRFQAEMLRAECKFLRMEKEIAVKKLGNETAFMESTLKSALHALISGKKKIREGGSVNAVFQEEIEELARKLAELKRCSKQKDVELRDCNNFDKRALILERQLEKLKELEDMRSVKKEMAESRSSIEFEYSKNGKVISSVENCHGVSDVETLRRKLEGLSKGMLLQKMEEEFGKMLSITANGSVSTSSSRRYDDPDLPSSSLWQRSQEAKSGDLRTCSGHCKAIVKRIMEQVRAETEQWTQMQEMLGQVREEMEELQASRDFWEERALSYERETQFLHASVQEWKRRALSLEVEENQLQKQVRVLQGEVERLRMEGELEAVKTKESVHVSYKENRVLTCRVKRNSQPSHENVVEGSKETTKKLHNSRCSKPPGPLNDLPLRDIRNLSHVASQNRMPMLPLH